MFHRPVPQDYEQYAAYWTAEPGWKTEIHLRNNLPDQSLTVTPALRTADGTEAALPVVIIKPNDVATVDLGESIVSSASRLVGEYGSIAFRYIAPVERALYAAVIVQLPGTPIEFHLDAFPKAPRTMTGGREGIWWLPTESAKDWLVLANTSDSSLVARLTLYESNGKALRKTLALGPRQTTRLSMRSLVQRGGLAASFGGISLDAGPRAADLDSAHFVYDETTGFLALMKMFDRDSSATLSQRSLTNSQWTIRAPMLPLTNPDPALALPAGTTLKPAIFLRNASANAYKAQLTFHWRSDTTTGKSTTSIALQPYVTTLVDVAALQANGTIPASAQWAYVSIAAPIKPDDLLAVATSFDATGRLGAQTPFTDQAANHWEGGMWEVDANHNTLIAVGNAGKSPSKAKITLYYNSGQGKYQVEQTLAQDEQIWVDVGKLIHTQVPDVKGTTIPVNTMGGGYELENLTDKPTDGLFEGKLVVNKTYGYAVHGCGICCPDLDPYLDRDPLDLSAGDSFTQSAWSYDTCKNTTSQVAASGWGTGNSQVATANSSGVISGVGAGSTTDYAYVRVMSQDYRGYCRWWSVQRSGTVNVVNGCPIPTTELTQVAGTSLSYPLETKFNQTISDSVGASFDGRIVAEQGTGGNNTCYWAGNAVGLVQHPAVSGGEWTVAQGEVSGQHNHWGYDYIGYTSTAVPSYVRQNGPAHGVHIPCGSVKPQSMVIYCDANTNYFYAGDSQTITINSTTVTNCRANVCQTINAP
jgi:hypothetical protein